MFGKNTSILLFRLMYLTDAFASGSENLLRDLYYANSFYRLFQIHLSTFVAMKK